MIAGAAGSAEPGGGFRTGVRALGRCNDRRGFSRSTVSGDQDYSRRLNTDDDDVRSLGR